MAWSFSDGKPIYAQLVERLQTRIVTGEYPPGARLDAVRDLSEQAGVNPNTMQRAMTELESLGLVHTQRTAGRFVTEDAERIAALKEELAREKLGRFLSEMEGLGFTRGEVLLLLENEEKRRDLLLLESEEKRRDLSLLESEEKGNE